MSLAEKYPPYYTVNEWEKWQGDWELIEGVPYALAFPSIEHQRIIAKLIVEINRSLENCKCDILPDIDYFISEDTVVRPDISVVCKKISGKLTIPPDIIFEVISPSSVKMDEHVKFELYQREKVNYYVLVYPYKNRKHIKIFKLENNSYRKVFETVDEIYSFGLDDCNLSVNFSKIWE